MNKEFQIQVSPETAADADALKMHVAETTGIDIEEIRHIEIIKKSIDARQRTIKINLKIHVYIDEDFEEISVVLPEYKDVTNAREIIIVGAGPAGLFAALKCIEKGLKPIIIERGKDVKSRVADIKAINLDGFVNEDSNYCFGEGGAGTFSDGKLYTRSKKRGETNRILELLVGFGATKEITVDSHPHIGTNKLPGIISNIRECIIAHGGIVHFNSRVTDIIIKNNEVAGVKIHNGTIVNATKLILATGHSARDMFELLHSKGIAIIAKPFALGVRVEHPQSIIDKIQYKQEERGLFLPPSSYNIVRQINNRGVYSFCMCPGGVIAPCATKNGEIVTNGWSPSRRDMPYANSGVVVELNLGDFKQFESQGALAAMAFQQSIEQKAWHEGGKTQKAPAQRLVDFVSGKQSLNLRETSYKPGITSVELKSIFPAPIHQALKEGFKEFEKAMKGYLTEEAVVLAPESRTSSPVRIPRDSETLEHISIKGLYPCGEGAGYAGGIVSAAIDGERCADKCVETLIY
ncbi:MAG: NAD(P)/FAD-dependent oxidoreductase [Bacteroidota bacterium]